MWRPHSAKQPDANKHSHTATDIYPPTRIDRYAHSRACDEHACRDRNSESDQYACFDKYRSTPYRHRSPGEYTAPATANRCSIPGVP